MLSQRALRLMLAATMLMGLLVVGSVAGAHSCVPSAGNPVDNGATISGHGEIDCTSAESGDVLTVKLWRVCTGCPDDFWVQSQDGFPPNEAGSVYSTTATGCEAADPPDDFKTETRGNSSLHSVAADNYSELNNLNC